MADNVCPFFLEILTLGVVFGLTWLIQCLILLAVHYRPFRRAGVEAKRRQPDDADVRWPGISIVVYAHNQEEQLLTNLPQLLRMDYPNYEVIVVDDASTDYTDDALTSLEQRYEHLYHTRLTDQVRTVSRRKLAFMLGIKAARYDVVLSTHAQCIPNSPRWLYAMARPFTEGRDVVLGPVTYEYRTGLASRFYAYDLFQRLLSLFAYTLAVRPFAGSGMNMAFRKQIFFDHHGFSRYLNLQPGEDDLFVAEVGRRGNTAVACSPDAVLTVQEHPQSYPWRALRLRRAFTSRFYAASVRCLMGLEVTTRYLAFFSCLALIVYTLLSLPYWAATAWYLFGAVVAMGLIALLLRVGSVHGFARRMKMHHYLFSPLLFDLITPLIDAYFRVKALCRHKSFYVGRI
jgi:cellulose synthase/poly-beta-1,6-N-acetylglucosamine synthase-like glycosyltransferase